MVAAADDHPPQPHPPPQDQPRPAHHPNRRRRRLGRTIQWTLIAILVSLVAFLGSFNLTMVRIIEGRREEIAIRQKAELKPSNPPELVQASSSSTSSNSNTNPKLSVDETVHKNLLEEHATLQQRQNNNNDNNNDETTTTTTTSTSQLHKQREKERQLQQELQNPTLGKYHTFHRQLDGFPALLMDSSSSRSRAGGAGNSEEEEDYDLLDKSRLYTRPTTTSYNRQSHYHSTPPPNPSSSSSSSTNLQADAHFAKALRMLSSKFDRMNQGGNALPHEVYEGNYRQDVGDRNGRGEGFVKMSVVGRRSGSGMGGVSGKRKQGNDGVSGGSHRRQQQQQQQRREMQVFQMAMEILHEWVTNMLDYLYDVFGIDSEYYNERGTRSTGSSSGSGGASNLGASGSGNHQRHHHHHDYFGGSSNEEDSFSWRDTRVGSQLMWISGKVAKLWSRRTSSTSSSSTVTSSSSSRNNGDSVYDASTGKYAPSSSSTSSSSSQEVYTLSQEDQLAREGLFHLEKAAELGHAEAQRMVANALASGILPLSDHSLLHRISNWQKHQHHQKQRHHSQESSSTSSSKNSTFITLTQPNTLQTPDDFSTGGQQLSRAILLWHLSAMDGNVESAMALGYRHLYSATGGRSLLDSQSFSPNYYDSKTGGPIEHHGTNPNSHYGVLGTCPTALAYYEAAANGVMDELESGPTKGKVNPPLDEHRLAEIHMRGGASVKLEGYNKPDEIEEALQYYRMLASRNHYPEPDLLAAFTIANFYYLGLRGVKQDLRLALKYYEICGDYNHWEGGGRAGLMHVWGVGMTLEERDLGKAYSYFKQGTPGGIDGCVERVRRKKRAGKKSEDEEEGEVSLCDRHCLNGMGLVSLFGIEGLVKRDVALARRWFELARDLGDPDGMYNYAMLRLGWMVDEVNDDPRSSRHHHSTANTGSDIPFPKQKSPSTSNDFSYMALRRSPRETNPAIYSGPSVSDFNVAIQELNNAAAKGHLQAKHKLGILYSTGAEVFQKTKIQPTKALTPSCTKALKYFKAVAENGHTISNRIRAAWKQYNAGEYESSLRNYLAAAETGSEVGQINAAFLLERGHCLGMTVEACTRASIRLWRAAARQGNLEACLRVGDFYYYGRMKKHRKRRSIPSPPGDSGESTFLYDEEDDVSYLSTLEGKAFYFAPGPYRWARYILYPEELVSLSSTWVRRSMQILRRYFTGGEAPLSAEGTPCSVFDEVVGTCSLQQSGHFASDLDNEDGEDHMAIAAHYYRKAAEEHGSPRANFNLGFMHEWGLGLTQDFPLAKRHYDMAADGTDAELASTVALFAMRIHEAIVKAGMNFGNGKKEGVMLTPDKDDGGGDNDIASTTIN